MHFLSNGFLVGRFLPKSSLTVLIAENKFSNEISWYGRKCTKDIPHIKRIYWRPGMLMYAFFEIKLSNHDFEKV